MGELSFTQRLTYSQHATGLGVVTPDESGVYLARRANGVVHALDAGVRVFPSLNLAGTVEDREDERVLLDASTHFSHVDLKTGTQQTLRFAAGAVIAPPGIARYVGPNHVLVQQEGGERPVITSPSPGVSTA